MGDFLMRILVVANLPPYVLGGAENQVLRLIETWADSGHHTEVAGHRIPNGVLGLGKAKVRTHHIKVISWAGRGGRAASYFVSMACLLNKIKKKFDVIYCRGLGDGAISICLLKAFGAVRLPLLVCPISGKGAGDSCFIRSIPGWPLLLPLLNRYCDAINIISPAILSDLIRLGINGPKITIFPNGVKTIHPIKKNQVASIRRLIWTGRLNTEKGIDILLKALSSVMASGKDFTLDIIGNGPNMDSSIKQCQELGLQKKVRFIGAIANDMIREKLANADVFLLPSRYEGMSNAVLEAMEAGLPILLTRCGGIDTYIDNSTGWICEPDDVNSLTDALLRMLDTPADKLLKMGNQARFLIERNFRIEKIGQQNADLLAQLVKTSGRCVDPSRPQ
jgi:glycosyltransferase involved in cell wall biosynthesis